MATDWRALPPVAFTSKFENSFRISQFEASSLCPYSLLAVSVYLYHIIPTVPGEREPSQMPTYRRYATYQVHTRCQVPGKP